MRNAIIKVLEAVQLDQSIRSAVFIMGPSTMARATRRFKPGAKDRRGEVVITWGELNHKEKALVRKCRKIGKKFEGLHLTSYK